MPARSAASHSQPSAADFEQCRTISTRRAESNPGRLDDKGRLKLPAGFREYFERVGADRVFITSLDRRTARIYTLPAWQSETSAANHDDRVSETMKFHADDLGAESDIDWQGRILIPWKLRQPFTKNRLASPRMLSL